MAEPQTSTRSGRQVRPSAERSARHLRAVAGAALIFAATCLAYFPSVRGGFILDDDTGLTQSPLVKAPDGLYRFWFTTEPLDYWPMVGTSFWLEWRLWEMNPTGYHVTNVLLHVVEALLIWVILSRLAIRGAFLGALLFAVHPVNVQSVAWISQRKNLLAMLFFLLSILWYLNAEPRSPPLRRGSPPRADRWYWLSLAAFILAMLSKGSVAILPLVLVGIIWWLRPLTRRDLVRVAPFVLVGIVMVLVDVWFQARVITPAVRGTGLIERLLGAGGVIWFYLYKALLPLHLSFVYPQWHIHADQWRWWLPLLAAIALTGVLWLNRRGWSRPVLFAWGYHCVALVPVMGFTLTVFMVEQSLVADHYQHLALIGVIALAAAGWGMWQQRAHGPTRWAANAAAVVVTLALALLTWRQSALYADGVTLFRAAMEQSPDSPRAHHNLGFVLVQAGRVQEAIAQYEHALRLEPDYAQAHNNLGAALAQAGRTEEAIGHFRQALDLTPAYPDAEHNLGAMLRESGRPEEAIAHFRLVLQRQPDSAAAQCNLGRTLLQAGRVPEAIEQFQQALRLEPDLLEARDALSAALTQAGQRQETIDLSHQAPRLDPNERAAQHDPQEALAAEHKAAEPER